MKSLEGQTAKLKAASILYKKNRSLIAELRAHSPKDTGEFKRNWKVKRAKFGTSRTLAGIIITNDTPAYGQFVAGGAEPKAAPWYYPHKSRKTGRFIKGTGKLKLSGGRVWAGGLNPGHAKTVGGPIVNVLTKFTDNFTQEFSDEFVKGFV